MTQITLYTAKISPFAHRVQIALLEAKANFREYEIDLTDKPAWFALRVNPASKVPALTYGGPDVPPDDPSPESVKLHESLVLVEFVADLFPDAKLLPEDPVFRAKARLFIDSVTCKFVPGCYKFVSSGEGYEDLLKATEAIQELLPQTGDYAVGDQYTIADIAITPFIGCVQVAAKHDVGKFSVGQGSEFLRALHVPKFEKYLKYSRRVLERPSYLAVFDEEHIKTTFAKMFGRA